MHPKIICTHILSVFRSTEDVSSSHVIYDISLINLFDDFRQPSVPYFRHSVDYGKIETYLIILENEIFNIDHDYLRKIGKLLWNLVIPREIRDYLSIISKEYSIQILIVTNDLSLPFEIVHDDSNFWALKYTIGRIYGTSKNYNLQLPQVSKNPESGQLNVLLAYNPEGNLEHAQKEGEKLQTLLENTFNINVLERDIYGHQLAMEVGSDNYDIIHFAGHAKLSESGSGLVLKDGLLESKEIACYSLSRHPVVFANACLTAAKQSYYGTDSQNIAEAFIEAGAAAFIGALWKISDETSAMFASTMYKYLRDGRTIGNSLLSAKLELSRISEGTNIDWAAFTLFGNPNHRLHSLVSKDNITRHNIQLVMSNEPGTLAIVLLALREVGANIVNGRSITFDDEITAGYISQIELPKDLCHKEFTNMFQGRISDDLLYSVKFV